MTPENEHEASALAPTKSLFAGGNTAPVDEPVEAVQEADDSEVTLEEVQEQHAAEDAAEPETADNLETGPEPVEDTQPEQEAPEAEAPVANAEVDNSNVPVTDGNDEAKPKTLKELQAEKADLDAKIEAQQKEERKAVIDQIAVVVKTYGIPIPELVSALGGMPNPRKGEKAPVLYKDDKGNKWTGRGKLPNWLKGKNLEDYKVK